MSLRGEGLEHLLPLAHNEWGGVGVRRLLALLLGLVGQTPFECCRQLMFSIRSSCFWFQAFSPF